MIIVKENYGGRLTNEARVEPGEYAEDDPRLFGIADHLIEIGVAERSGPAPSGKKEKPSKADQTPADQGKADAQSGGETLITVEVDKYGRPKAEADNAQAGDKSTEPTKDDNADQGKADAQSGAA